MSIDNFMANYAVLLSQWLVNTVDLASFNQMHNDTRFIQAQLSDRRDKLDRAATRTHALVRTVRDANMQRRAAVAWYSFVCATATRVVLVGAVVCALLTLASMGRISSTAAWVVSGVFAALMLLLVVGSAMQLAARRSTHWDRFYWKPIAEEP